eukprot:2630337-Pyramimonas_sp.AAC.1
MLERVAHVYKPSSPSDFLAAAACTETCSGYACSYLHESSQVGGGTTRIRVQVSAITVPVPQAPYMQRTYFREDLDVQKHNIRDLRGESRNPINWIQTAPLQ